MRLIDADEAKRILDSQELMEHLCKVGQKNSHNLSFALAQVIDNRPTAYDVDAVAKQLEEEEEYSHADFESYAEEHGIDSNDDWHYAGLKRAIEIVKGGGVDAKTDS